MTVEPIAFGRPDLGGDPSEAAKRVEAVLGRRPIGIKRWERARKHNGELHLASSLTFGERCELLPTYGLEQLASLLVVESAWLKSELWVIKELRDALAHTTTMRTGWRTRPGSTTECAARRARTTDRRG